MAATAWTLYNLAKKKIGTGDIDLDTHTFTMSLFKGSSNASTFTISLVGSVTVAVSGGYVGEKTLASVVWTAGGSAGVMKWDASNPIFTASGANIGSCQYAVVAKSGAPEHALCWSKLSSAAFTVTDGNTLTVQINSGGFFTLA